MNKLLNNKRNAIDFYRLAYLGQAKKAVDLYVGHEYLQHNPDVADGKQGFIDYFDKMHAEYPNKSIDFVRAIAEGDMVSLHTHQVWPDEAYVTMDFFRFDEKGKIVEHWDAIQKIPKLSKSGRTMY